MEESVFTPDDLVVYYDADLIPWGPWKVVAGSGDTIIVLVDGLMEQAIPSDRLRKVDEGDEGVDRSGGYTDLIN